MALTGEIEKVEKGKDPKRVKVKIKGRLKDVCRWEEFLAKLKVLGRTYGFSISTSAARKKSKKKKAVKAKKK